MNKTNITPNASPAMQGQTHQFTKRDIGCAIDESCGSADNLNERTVALAAEYGFTDTLLFGCFDGLRGLGLNIGREDAEYGSHQGSCDASVADLATYPYIVAQLDAMDKDALRDGLRESGAWDGEELSDDEQNRLRAVWLAACDARENASQQLSEMADDAVLFLNDIPAPSYCSWYFEDNSLFFTPCLDNAREDVGFVSSREQDEPERDYEGEWLHISDHGNATLYVREAGHDTEIWSIV